MRKSIVVPLLVLFLAVSVVVPALATDDGGDATTTSVSDATTTVPDDGESDTGSVTPWWLLILVGVALIMIVAALVSRGSSPTTEPSPATWKDRARTGYAEGRWLADSLSEDLAIWRGNSAVDAGTTPIPDSGRAHEDTWKQVPIRLENAKTALYSLEASAPDSRARSYAQSAVVALDTLRAAVDSRADARATYRTLERSEPSGSPTLAEARDREIRSSTNLHRSRDELSKALGALATIL